MPVPMAAEPGYQAAGVGRGCWGYCRGNRQAWAAVGASEMGFLLGTPQAPSLLLSLFRALFSFLPLESPGLQARHDRKQDSLEMPGPWGPGAEGLRGPGQTGAGAGAPSGSYHPVPGAASSAAAAWWWGTGTGCATARWERPSTSTTWSSGLYERLL